MILITGGSGWVGAVVAAALRRRGVPIALLSRSPSSDARIRAWIGEVPIMRGDVERPLAGVADLASLHGAHIVHLAAVVRLDDDAQVRRVNVDGTRHVLDLADAVGARHFSYMSTTAVAGDAPRFGEDDVDVGQSFRNAYERSKLEAEQLVRAWQGSWTILRMPVLVGDSVTGASAGFSGAFYRVAAAAWLAREALEEAAPDELAREGIVLGPAGWRLPGCLRWTEQIPCEVVTQDWLAEVVATLVLDPPGGTVHLLHPSPPTVGEVVPEVLALLGIDARALLAAPPPTGPWGRMVQRTFDRVAGVHRPYLNHVPLLGRARLGSRKKPHCSASAGNGFCNPSKICVSSPGPSSTESSAPVNSTWSPTLRPVVDSNTCSSAWRPRGIGRMNGLAGGTRRQRTPASGRPASTRPANNPTIGAKKPGLRAAPPTGPVYAGA